MVEVRELAVAEVLLEVASSCGGDCYFVHGFSYGR